MIFLALCCLVCAGCLGFAVAVGWVSDQEDRGNWGQPQTRPQGNTCSSTEFLGLSSSDSQAARWRMTTGGQPDQERQGQRGDFYKQNSHYKHAPTSAFDANSGADGPSLGPIAEVGSGPHTQVAPAVREHPGAVDGTYKGGPADGS